jgi:endonuclease/exonuclease/phosphatase (EEP) superfamily protein YafD
MNHPDLHPRASHRPTRRALGIVLPVVLAALAATSCLTTRNFKDPDGPRYQGSHAPAVTAADDPGGAARPFKVVTFNIEFARHIDAALRLLRSDTLRADVLLLQEMDSKGVEQIARDLQLNYVYYPSAIHPMAGHEFGTAVLSRWPLVEPRKIALPHAAFGTRVVRSVTSAVVQYGSQRIRVYAVHLPAPGAVTTEERKEQVDIIAAEATKVSDPVIVGGDFNGRVVGGWFRDAGFLWVTDRLPPTSSALGLGFRWSYDHLFTRGLEPAPAKPASGIVNPEGASDHRAVWALLRFAPPAQN